MSRRPTFEQELLREQARQRRHREGGRHTDLSDRMDSEEAARLTHTNTITTVYKDNRSPQTRRISTRTAGGRTVNRRGRGRGRGRGQ